jgi:hypothetical protein
MRNQLQTDALLWSAKRDLEGAERVDPARRKFIILENNLEAEAMGHFDKLPGNVKNVKAYLNALVEQEKANVARIAELTPTAEQQTALQDLDALSAQIEKLVTVPTGAATTATPVGAAVPPKTA